MTKVLQIPNYMYPHIGGIEQVGRDIADSLSTCKDIEQKIICFNGDAKDGDYVCNQQETVMDIVDGIEVVRCGVIKKVSSQSLSVTYRKELKKIMNEFKPDIVIFHYPNPFVTALLEHYYNRQFKLIVYWHLDITKQKILGKLFHPQTIRLLNRADKVIATSPNYIVGSAYLNKYKNKCEVIPNCIRPERLAENDETNNKIEEIRNKHKGKTICYAVGRHVEYKGIEYLIKASGYLDDSFVILIGGKGPLTNELKDMAKDDNKIEFLGRVDEKDMVAYYKACDIFCFPSITKNEAFGIALAEAMYFGKPAVTFNICGSGVNYVNLNNKTGIECENKNSKEFANAIEKLKKNNVLREQYGKNAKERVINNFLYNKFTQNIKELIENI